MWSHITADYSAYISAVSDSNTATHCTTFTAAYHSSNIDPILSTIRDAKHRSFFSANISTLYGDSFPI
jgi:hypothetical protein